MKHVAVLMGGWSAERPVSLNSGRGCADALHDECGRRLVAEFVNHYNTVRLHSAIASITPADKLAGRAEAIWAARKQKLATANARGEANSRATLLASVAKGFSRKRSPAAAEPSAVSDRTIDHRVVVGEDHRSFTCPPNRSRDVAQRGAQRAKLFSPPVCRRMEGDRRSLGNQK